jgi:hypothetical protein
MTASGEESTSGRTALAAVAWWRRLDRGWHAVGFGLLIVAAHVLVG